MSNESSVSNDGQSAGSSGARGRVGAIAGVVAVLALVLGGVWYFVVRDAPAEERVSLDALTGGPSTSPGSAAPAAGAAVTGASATAPGPEGSWTVQAADDVTAGYRITKRLPTGDQEVTGRTGKVTGTATIAGGALTAAEIKVDVASITSGNSIRDGKMRSEGLETDRFPTASFSVTTPVTLPAATATGTKVDLQVPGRLTLHGVTKDVTMPMQAVFNGSSIGLVGTASIALADFGMQPPSIPGGSVADAGELEFQIRLIRA